MQREGYPRLSNLEGIHFIGNMEANRFAFDTCDVLVTDGFTGNILLKGVEGIGKLMFGSIKSALKSSPIATLGALLVKKPLKGMKKQLDPNEYGGAPLLGISHPVIKAHGSSNAKAFKNAIRQAIQYAESGMIEEISKEAAAFEERRKMEREAARAEKAQMTQSDPE
jgi:glycerol-3-phosphate acyltransferase PlsX